MITEIVPENTGDTGHLFLDIDGVLHPDDAGWFDYKSGVVKGIGLFRWLNILLEEIKDRPNLRVVLHSSWRFIWPTIGELKANLPPELTKVIFAVTNTDINGRYESILDYCHRHGVANYVILDDDLAAFGSETLGTQLPPELIPTWGGSGINTEKVQSQLKKALDRIAPKISVNNDNDKDSKNNTD